MGVVKFMFVTLVIAYETGCLLLAILTLDRYKIINRREPAYAPIITQILLACTLVPPTSPALRRQAKADECGPIARGSSIASRKCAKKENGWM